MKIANRVQDCSRSFTTIQDHSTIQIPEFLIVTLNRFKPEVRWRHTVLRISVPNLDIFSQKLTKSSFFIINHIFRSKTTLFYFESFHSWKSPFLCHKRPWERHRYGIEGWLTVINRGKWVMVVNKKNRGKLVFEMGNILIGRIMTLNGFSISCLEENYYHRVIRSYLHILL